MSHPGAFAHFDVLRCKNVGKVLGLLSAADFLSLLAHVTVMKDFVEVGE